LRDVVAAAQPGVTITINVHTGKPSPKQNVDPNDQSVLNEATEDNQAQNTPHDKIHLINAFTTSATQTDPLPPNWPQLLLRPFHPLAAPIRYYLNKLHRTLAFILEITIMFSSIISVILLAWFGLSLIAYILDRLIPIDFATQKRDESANGVCPAPKPFEKPPQPMCSKSRWQVLWVYGVRFGVAVVSAGVVGVCLGVRSGIRERRRRVEEKEREQREERGGKREEAGDDEERRGRTRVRVVVEDDSDESD
jgi:hypothetical protein